MAFVEKINVLRVISALISFAFILQSALLEAASMNDYCIMPPYVKTDVSPNVLLLMDNSQIMGNTAYDPTSLDPNIINYSSAKIYPGYFRSDLWYTYSGGQFVPDVLGIFKGNLLNWAATSRYDLLESILVGGKSVSRQTNINTLVGMSNSWSKKYGGCIFNVNSGNLQITDDPDIGMNSCSLLSGVRLLASNKTDAPPAYAALSGIFGDGNNRKFGLSNILRSLTGGVERLVSFVIDSIIPSAYAAKPLRITTNSLPDAPQNMAGYSATLSAEGGVPPYAWSISAGSLPAGLSLDGPLGVISGTPTAALGTYSFTIKVTDDTGASNTRNLSIKVIAGVRVANFNIRVCVGDYVKNCNTALNCASSSDCPTGLACSGGSCAKAGIVDLFWSQARFGIEDFSQSGGTISPNIGQGTCIPASPKENFLTGIENATPVGDSATFTPLVNGMYTAVDYYKSNTDPNCNPFNNAQKCLKNFILLISAGEGADNPPDPNPGTLNVFSDAAHCVATSTPPASFNLSKNSCYGYNNDLRPDEMNYKGKQYVSTYIVNTMGVNGNILNEAATAGGGAYYDVTDPTQLREQLIKAFQDIIKRAAAGTAASVLASGEGSGANLVQALFYPRTPTIIKGGIFEKEIDWIGRLQNFWYYLDPFFSSSSILDDSGVGNGKKLNLSSDKVVKLHYDTLLESTMADRYTFGGSKIDSIPMERVNGLWEAGLLLWNRNLASDPRTIYVNNNGVRDTFSTDKASTLRPYLQAADDTEASKIIQYIHGYDKFCSNTATPCNDDTQCIGVSCVAGYRQRSTKLDLNGDRDFSDTVTVNGVSISESPLAGEWPRAWKLGDVLNSTPKIASWMPLNLYDTKFFDKTYKNPDYDSSQPVSETNKPGYVQTSKYTERGVVFAGANDGMLHAFKLGKLGLKWSGQAESEKARLDGDDLGKELWAFIPMNALPYLKYNADNGYCHVYTVDLTPYVFDASINGTPTDTRTSDSWRTIVIGGMRFGGSCRNMGNACTDCVKTPVANLGYSSYFALDVTDFLANQSSPPTLLWEFSSENLGFATTGPSVVRVGDRDQNGNWFVVFGSGPTGPISTSDRQFLGRSDQNLRLFVLDLKDGSVARTIDTGISSGFAGSILSSTIDVDVNYQDDVIYIPYVNKAFDGTWTKGGVLRLLTRENTSPSNWELSTVMSGIGPVTSSVVHLRNTRKGVLWLYFGEGRYYFEQLDTVDDGTNQRKIYGLIESCFDGSNFKASCSSLSASTDVTSNPNASSDSITDGWYISLDDASDPSYRAERVITDPLATTSGVVFFTSYKPYNDICSLGGKSFVWALKYNTGGKAGALLQGKALLQVSTGSIEQIDLPTIFEQGDKGGRRSASMEGVPPVQQGLSIQKGAPPVKRVFHMRER